jgi:hypothetical protein
MGEFFVRGANLFARSLTQSARHSKQEARAFPEFDGEQNLRTAARVLLP